MDTVRHAIGAITLAAQQRRFRRSQADCGKRPRPSGADAEYEPLYARLRLSGSRRLSRLYRRPRTVPGLAPGPSFCGASPVFGQAVGDQKIDEIICLLVSAASELSSELYHAPGAAENFRRKSLCVEYAVSIAVPAISRPSPPQPPTSFNSRSKRIIITSNISEKFSLFSEHWRPRSPPISTVKRCGWSR